AAAEAAGSFAPVELDMTTGARGSRHAHVARQVCSLTGAEGAVVVNNNAAALMLVLSTVAPGQGVAVARGELIEIGGSFRLPEIIESGGARLREVGTTNRTRVEDFERALRDAVAILRIHTSNYRVEGFCEMPSIRDLATVARRWDVPLIHDTGSGLLSDEVRFEIPEDEPSAASSLRDGADLVLFSGDKILGGPQCGIIAGRRAWIDRIASHPMMRAMRLDKIRLAALDRTLAIWRDPSRARAEIPLLRMLGISIDDLTRRAERLSPSMGADVVATEAFIGGGSVPGRGVASVGLAIRTSHPDALMDRLRRASPPVVARVHDGAVVFDLRTVEARDDDHLVHAVQ
ncbi:MAG: L-seryl-tRNA(Sec) selenium transferase, partial [Phycisphaerales bacterium]|nr:L-seryl-tRNA(Sec) selenium transferase [Phycisphaerales bacterium]